MNPRAWGPAVWRLLHAVAHRAKDRPVAQRRLCRLVCLLPKVMPCSLCRNSFGAILEGAGAQRRGPAWDTADPEPLLWDLHNRVNAKLGRVGAPSLADLRVVAAAREAAGQFLVSHHDIWFLLFIFAGCSDALRVASSPQERQDCPIRQWHLCKFIHQLRRALAAADMFPDIVDRLKRVPWSRHECAAMRASTRVADAAGVPVAVVDAVIRTVQVVH